MAHRAAGPSSPLIPGLSAPISARDGNALTAVLSNASNRAFPGCSNPEHPLSIQLALSYMHQMSSEYNRFPVLDIFNSVRAALSALHATPETLVQLWIDGLLPYHALTGRQWFQIGMNPYAQYTVLSICDDGTALTNRLWIRLERVLARFNSRRIPLPNADSLYIPDSPLDLGPALRAAAIQLLIREHDHGETYWIDDKDRIYEWALEILQLRSDSCSLRGIVLACLRPGDTMHVQVKGKFTSPNTVIREAFNIEGRILTIDRNIRIVSEDSRQENRVKVCISVADRTMVLHAKHYGKRFGTSFEDVDIMDVLATAIPKTRFIGEGERLVIKTLSTHLANSTVSDDDIEAEDRRIRRLHNMKPISELFCSDDRGRLLWKYRENIFVIYHSRDYTGSNFGTLNMLKGSRSRDLPYSSGADELLMLANDLTVPAEIRALAVHDYQQYEENVVIELAHSWTGGLKKGRSDRINIDGDQLDPGRILAIGRRMYVKTLFLLVMERRGLSFKTKIENDLASMVDYRFYGKMTPKEHRRFCTSGLPRNVGSLLGDNPMKMQVIHALTDRLHHPNDFMFSRVDTYTTNLRGLDVESYDQNARALLEGGIQEAFVPFALIVMLILEIFLPMPWVYMPCFLLGLYALIRILATPGRFFITVVLELLIVISTRPLGMLVPLVVGVIIDYFLSNQLPRSHLCHRRVHLLVWINDSLQKLSMIRWKLLQFELSGKRLFSKCRPLRPHVVSAVLRRNASSGVSLGVVGVRCEHDSRIHIFPTANELVSAGVFLGETSDGDIVSICNGKIVGRYAYRNRAGVLFFQPWGEYSFKGPRSLLGRFIVGDVEIGTVEALENDKSAEENTPEGQTEELELSERAQKALDRALEEAIANSTFSLHDLYMGTDRNEDRFRMRLAPSERGDLTIAGTVDRLTASIKLRIRIPQEVWDELSEDERRGLE